MAINVPRCFCHSLVPMHIFVFACVWDTEKVVAVGVVCRWFIMASCFLSSVRGRWCFCFQYSRRPSLSKSHSMGCSCAACVQIDAFPLKQLGLNTLESTVAESMQLPDVRSSVRDRSAHTYTPTYMYATVL